MEALGDYIFSLVCGGILCAIVLAFCGSGPGYGMRRMLCGIFLAFLAIAPLKQMDFDDFSAEFESYSADAEQIAEDGKNQASEAAMNIITETCASYILTEAAQLGAEVSVEVTVDGKTNEPNGVTVTGTLTPYAKQMLSGYMTDTLGIPKEAQTWNGS